MAPEWMDTLDGQQDFFLSNLRAPQPKKPNTTLHNERPSRFPTQLKSSNSACTHTHLQLLPPLGIRNPRTWNNLGEVIW